ncbi:MAG: hypothetical protein ACFE9C_13215 [Candidatus Hodarchaeota archaeon]
MLKKEKLILFLICFLFFIVLFSCISHNYGINYIDNNNDKINNNPELSASMEGIENVVITKVNRNTNITAFGLLIFEDSLDVKNFNNFPISSIFFGLPSYDPEDLIFFKATGNNGNTLLAERSNTLMNGFEMVVIYFNSPLLPYQTTSIKFTYIYKDIMVFALIDHEYAAFLTTVYPTLPYKIEGEIYSYFRHPSGVSQVEGDWGVPLTGLDMLFYDFEDLELELGIDSIAPFLENLGDKGVVRISFWDDERTKTEMKRINRNIYISPWGIIRVNEEFSIENLGNINFNTITFKIPKHASNLYIYDDLGEIFGVVIQNTGAPKTKKVTINLWQNRVTMTPNSSSRFNVEYNLPFEKYVSSNWLQQSIQIDLLTTTFSYLGRDQTTNVIIDGCYNINSITEYPVAIKRTHGATILEYKSDYVSPIESKIIQLTFTINIFDILLRPTIFIFIIAILGTSFVLVIKLRKREYDKDTITSGIIPVNEIREFCSLYEEKNALTLEIRKAEEDIKRKKISKKKYKNIIAKNDSKIDEIQKEIITFKKAIMETAETFENIIKKLDVLEAERISVKDSLSLLESRYKRGRLPSRAAYQKLSDDFKKRRRKIDRTMDKLIQQLRSYLL